MSPREKNPIPDATVSAAGMRVMKLLVGNRPQAVSDLTVTTGVTRTAVTEQLNELLAAGLVERTTQRLSGRGRPRHLYKTTDYAMAQVFAGNQRLVAPTIWKAIREVGGEELVGKILKRVSRTMADHYLAKITAPKPRERLRQFIGLLKAEGGVIEVEEFDGQVVIHRRSCPFMSMADPQRSVCRVDLELLGAVVGATVRRTACRLDGAPCCTFEIVGSVAADR
jgi:DeoR family transcriptional regulator, suf operon transcriptional repressor